MQLIITDSSSIDFAAHGLNVPTALECRQHLSCAVFLLKPCLDVDSVVSVVLSPAQLPSSLLKPSCAYICLIVGF